MGADAPPPVRPGRPAGHRPSWTGGDSPWCRRAALTPLGPPDGWTTHRAWGRIALMPSRGSRPKTPRSAVYPGAPGGGASRYYTEAHLTRCQVCGNLRGLKKMRRADGMCDDCARVLVPLWAAAAATAVGSASARTEREAAQAALVEAERNAALLANSSWLRRAVLRITRPEQEDIGTLRARLVAADLRLAGAEGANHRAIVAVDRALARLQPAAEAEATQPSAAPAVPRADTRPGRCPACKQEFSSVQAAREHYLAVHDPFDDAPTWT